MGLQPVIYVDTLVFMNTVVTFILLLTGARFSQNKPPPGRLMVASVVGGLYSLILLAPVMPIWAMLLSKVAMSVSLVALAYPIKSVRGMLRGLCAFCLVSFFYAGILYAVKYTLTDLALEVNNGYGYYNFSVFAILIICTAISLAVRVLYRHFFASKQKDRICDLTLTLGETQIKTKALMDTGCELTDVYTDSPVIVLASDEAFRLTGLNQWSPPEEKVFLLYHMRFIPVSSVSGKDLLPAFTVDNALIHTDDFDQSIKNPSVAVCRENVWDERYRALLNPDKITS